MDLPLAAGQAEFFTEFLEIIVVILVAIEIVELFYNMRAIQRHEKELELHLEKLEQATAKHAKELDAYLEKLQEKMTTLDDYADCVKQLDEHIKATDKLLEKGQSKEK